jgi:2-polyprenyl-3-methyl-5-hydroxy-6-metoxy-1,4-benzoquinol methylase
MRNVSLAFKVASALYWVFGEQGKGQYRDAAGGYGMLTRMMRDLGFDFYWSDAYCENLMARGFEYSPAVGNCEAVTAMEVMEHLTDPLPFVENILKESGADSLIFTT